MVVETFTLVRVVPTWIFATVSLVPEALVYFKVAIVPEGERNSVDEERVVAIRSGTWRAPVPEAFVKFKVGALK